MINYTARIGTHGPNSLYAINGDIAYAGPGDDQLFLAPFNHAYLIGGSGNDTYYLGVASYAVILDSGGHDTVVAPFSLSPGSTYAVTVDGGRHLVLGDTATQSLILIEDIRNHPIETFNFIGLSTSQHGMESLIRANGMHRGDVAYGQMEQLGLGSESFWSVGMLAEIDHILTREAELFWPAPTPVPEPVPAPEPSTPKVALVDANWYLMQNPDVAAAGIDATAHYMQWGWREGRDPNSLFDTNWYLAHNLDVLAAGINPLQHYMNYGWKEGRDPSANFDTSSYLEKNPDVALAGIVPLEHYLLWGAAEGRAI